MLGREIVFTGEMKVEVRPFELDDKVLKEKEVVSETLYSLISPGTELAALTGAAERLHGRPPSYPSRVGYAAVDRVTATGIGVEGLKPGDAILNMGRHASCHRTDISRSLVVKVPLCVPSEEAPFARLCGVAMTTLRTTSSKSGDLVAVFGLGLIGNLAAQIFQASGYEVVGVDVNPGRRLFAEKCGIRHILGTSEGLTEAFSSTTGGETCDLALECSGSAHAILEALSIARVGAEVVQVATPWKEYPDVSASQLLRPVFLKYLHLRGGWEWEIPLFPANFARGSILQNYQHALRLIARREVRVKELITHVLKPERAQEAYEGLLNLRSEYMGVLINWST